MPDLRSPLPQLVLEADQFNQNPPCANYASSANNFIGGYDLTWGGPRGRYIYATIRYNLH